jgi:hypothetical protein
MEYITNFKKESDWMTRLASSRHLRNKYTNKIPVLIDRLKKTTPKPLRQRFLIPKDMKGGEFMHVVRKYIEKITPEQGIYLFVGDAKTLFPNSLLMSEIYVQYKDADDFLYIVYDYENTFGCE